MAEILNINGLSLTKKTEPMAYGDFVKMHFQLQQLMQNKYMNKFHFLNKSGVNEFYNKNNHLLKQFDAEHLEIAKKHFHYDLTDGKLVRGALLEGHTTEDFNKEMNVFIAQVVKVAI